MKLHKCKSSAVLLALAASGISVFAAAGKDEGGPEVSAIIEKSVAANTADWKLQPLYARQEHDIKTKVDSGGKGIGQQSKTYDVTMLEGSPYYRLTALNNEPLPPEQAQQEHDKFAREVQKRKTETSDQRKARLAKYQNERAEEHLLMQQMVDAFIFKLRGEERVNGIDCYLFDASPNPDYSPPVEKARVLLGMRGHLWVDKAGYHWVKVEAEVTKPVQFGYFIAQVKPGTRFQLEQAPVDGVWLPKHFTESVNASVFGIYNMRSRQEEIYSNYEPLSARHAERSPTHAVSTAEAALSGSRPGGSGER